MIGTVRAPRLIPIPGVSPSGRRNGGRDEVRFLPSMAGSIVLAASTWKGDEDAWRADFHSFARHPEAPVESVLVLGLRVFPVPGVMESDVKLIFNIFVLEGLLTLRSVRLGFSVVPASRLIEIDDVCATLSCSLRRFVALVLDVVFEIPFATLFVPDGFVRPVPRYLLSGNVVPVLSSVASASSYAVLGGSAHGYGPVVSI